MNEIKITTFFFFWTDCGRIKWWAGLSYGPLFIISGHLPLNFYKLKNRWKLILLELGEEKNFYFLLFFYLYIYLFRICGKTATAQRSASSSRTCTIRGRRITCCWIGQSEQPLWFELSAADGRSLLRSHSLETQSPFANQNKFSGFQPYQPPRMSKKQIYYSDKYNDEDFEYRYNCRFGVVVDVNVLEEC